MSEVQANRRIDAGIKRGPRKQIDRRPKAALTGMFVSKHTPEEKQALIQQAQEAILAGETTDQFAARKGISGRTVRYWLLDVPEAEQARRALINGELARTLEEMREARHADSPLPLACAREEFRAWSWIAERRESKLYGQRLAVESKQVTDPATQELASAALDLLRHFREKVVNPPIALDIKDLEEIPLVEGKEYGGGSILNRESRPP